SPAAQAGLKAGDRIVRVGERPITRWETLASLLDRQGEAPITMQAQSLGEAPRELVVQQETRRWRDLYRQEHSYLWFGAEPYQSREVPPPEPIRGRFTYAARSAIDETLAM